MNRSGDFWGINPYNSGTLPEAIVGAPKTTFQHLPPRMKCRVRSSGRYYYYATQGSDRKEIPLGKGYREALKKYKVIIESETIGGTAIPPDYHKILYRNVVKGARSRGIDVLITEYDIALMFEKSGGKCILTGIKFDLRTVSNMRVRPWAPSIDRIDASRPYEASNCRIVCAAINIALNSFGDDIFYALAHGVVRTKRYF